MNIKTIFKYIYLYKIERKKQRTAHKIKPLDLFMKNN